MEEMSLVIVEGKLITLRKEQVLINSDVAQLYGVQTKEINQAVKNNPDKFPFGYVLVCTKEEKEQLVKNFDRFEPLKHSNVNPTAFTEKGLYMLATILKSERAIQTTISIVETFAKIRELSRVVAQIPDVADEVQQKSLLKKSGQLFGDIFDDNLEVTDSELSIELNLAVLKVKRIVKKKKK